MADVITYIVSPPHQKILQTFLIGVRYDVGGWWEMGGQPHKDVGGRIGGKWTLKHRWDIASQTGGR